MKIRYTVSLTYKYKDDMKESFNNKLFKSVKKAKKWVKNNYMLFRPTNYYEFHSFTIYVGELKYETFGSPHHVCKFEIGL